MTMVRSGCHTFTRLALFASHGLAQLFCFDIKASVRDLKLSLLFSANDSTNHGLTWLVDYLLPRWHEVLPDRLVKQLTNLFLNDLWLRCVEIPPYLDSSKTHKPTCFISSGASEETAGWKYVLIRCQLGQKGDLLALQTICLISVATQTWLAAQINHLAPLSISLCNTEVHVEIPAHLKLLD